MVKAIKDQVDRYLHVMVYGEFVESPQVKLAEALCKTLPSNLNNCYLVNSGTEATEGAMKLAKRFTGRSEIIACRKAYHGSSQGALSLSGEETFKRAYRPLLPDIQFVEYGNVDDIEKITNRTAAIFLETIQGEAGVRAASRDYFQLLRKRCSETGTLLILDEIQCGMGRTGTFWAFEHFDFVPDILLAAKGLGGGMPIGAFIASKEMMQSLTEKPILGHITTFGGHPVSAAAALATVQTIQEEELPNRAEEVAYLFKQNLNHPKINEIRNQGLMMAMDLGSFDLVQKLMHSAFEKGLITDWFLFNDTSIRIAPPLVISDEEVLKACDILTACLDNL